MSTGNERASGRGARAPSIRDVADAAAVSHQTVSRVLNDHPSVRPQTKQRVLDAIGELGYRPSRAARTLATARHRTIGLLLAARAQYGPFSTAIAIEDAARMRGYATTSASIGARDEVRSAISALVDHGIDGLAIIAPQAEVQAEVGRIAGVLPIVAFEWRSPAAVAIDQLGGARASTEHLLALGHRRIAHIAGPPEWFEAEERARGFVTTLARHGLRPYAVAAGDWSAAAGFAAGKRLLAQGDRPTAVFAGNDQMALGVLHAAHELGIDVPGELSVVGFDDIPEAAHFQPPLTTVRQDFAALGRLAVTRLLSEIEDGERPPAAGDLPAELIVRASTGPAH